MRRAPRARGVFSRIRPTASAVIRNHTCWLPSASSAAPNQRIRPLGSRVGSRGVRVWAPPGQSSRVPAMTIFGPTVVVQTVEPEGRLGLGLDVQLALKRPDRWWGCKAHANLPDPPLPYKHPEPGLLPSAGVTRLPR